MLRGPAILFLALMSVSSCPAQVSYDLSKARISTISESGGVSRYLVNFPSPVEATPSANSTVYFEYWTPHSASPVPAIILLHPLGASDLEEEYTLAREFTAGGMAVVMPTLPYHMRRSVPGLSRGQGMVGADVPLMVKSIGQAGTEIAYITAWLRSRLEIDAGRLGISGVSLGAIVASLELTTDSPYRSSVLILAGGDVADIMWNGAMQVLVRRKLKRQGYTEERLAEELRSVDPVNVVSPNWSDHVLMINAEYDPVISKRDTLALWEALGKPDITWIDSGHYIPDRSSRERVASLATRFFQSQFGIARAFHPESRVPAHVIKVGVFVQRQPTLSFGGAAEVFALRPRAIRPTLDVNVNTTGFSIGAGFDLGKNLTIGVQQRVWPLRADIRPYALFYIVL